MARASVMTVLILLLVGSAVAFCAEAEKPAAQQGVSAAEREATPQGPIVVEDEWWILFVDEPGYRFHRARDFFLRKDAKAAAQEIRKASFFVRMEAARGVDKADKDVLMASVNELRKLADDVERGSVVSAKRLDEAFARAHYRLAKHHQVKAKAVHAKGEHRRVGHELNAAAHHLEHGIAWSGHEAERGTLDVIKGARLVSGKLVQGTGWTVAEVGKAIDDVGTEIDKLGKRIEPARR
jgi:hypothetical protein